MEQIVAVLLPQILDGVQHVPRERVRNLVGKQVVDVPVPHILEEIVELVAGEVVCNARTGVSDSTGGRAHNPPPFSVVDLGGWREVRTRVWR